ncbi:MAG: Rpn family recombination-promoting nuclease/putative transposase [Flavobacteriales bacterium]
MKNINPHDHFFKEAFSDRETAISLIKDTFPEELVRGIDLRTLWLENTSYTDKELKEHFADLVYSCNYGNTRIRISLLLEHKSSPEKYPHLQLLKYMLRSWEEDIKQGEELRPVLPVIIYHGKGKWHYKRFQDHFNGIDDHLRQYMPEFDYQLTDISSYDDRTIEAFTSGFLQISAFLLKYRQSKDHIKEHLRESLVKFINNETSRNEERIDKFIEVTVRYLLLSTELQKDEIVKIFFMVSQKTGEKAMTAGEKLIEEGMQKGKQEGMKEGMQKGKQEGKLEANKKQIKNLYAKKKMKVEDISDLLELEKEFVKKTLKEEGLL